MSLKYALIRTKIRFNPIKIIVILFNLEKIKLIVF
jgi:hypothetical protein